MLDNIGERIKWIRNRSGESQTEFANKMGISRSKLLKLESSNANPDADFLLELVNQGYSANWILSGELPIDTGTTQLSDNEERYIFLAGVVVSIIEKVLQEKGLRLKWTAYKQVTATFYQLALEFVHEGNCNLNYNDEWMETELIQTLSKHIENMLSIVSDDIFI